MWRGILPIESGRGYHAFVSKHRAVPLLVQYLEHTSYTGTPGYQFKHSCIQPLAAPTPITFLLVITIQTIYNPDDPQKANLVTFNRQKTHFPVLLSDPNMPQLTWLVTGCSSGFGEAFVHGILARGDRVIATGRQADTKLSHLKTTGASMLELDVTAPQAEIDAKIDEALRIYGSGIDVVVNNAGYMQSGFVEEMTFVVESLPRLHFSHQRTQPWLIRRFANTKRPERLNRQLSTNLYGPIAVTCAILPHFRAKQSGILVFISSQSAWRGDPSIGAYAASKFALEGTPHPLSISKKLPQRTQASTTIY